MYISLRFIGCIEACLYVYLATFEDKIISMHLNNNTKWWQDAVNEMSKLEC